MESKSQQFSKFFVVLLLMLFIFALGNIIFNLENLDLGGEDVPEFVQGGSIQNGNLASGSTLTNALRWVYFGFLGFMALALIIGAFTFTKSKDKKKWKNLFYQMAGSVIIVGLIIGFGVFYEDIESGLTDFGNTDIIIGGGSDPDYNQTAVSDPPDTIKVIATLGIFAFFFSIIAIIFIAVTALARHRSTNLDYSDLGLQAQEVAETIQRTIDALAGGSDTRATVIRCYTDMCKVMAKYGVVEEEHLTPREFEKQAKDALPVPDKLIHELIMVFEEARYSNHELDAQDSQRALTALEGVKGKLDEFEANKNKGDESNG